MTHLLIEALRWRMLPTDNLVNMLFGVKKDLAR